MLEASREEDRCYAEIADVIRAKCVSPTRDVQQLWRRMVFNLLITNVDHHLQNHGFLYQGKGQWRLGTGDWRQPSTLTPFLKRTASPKPG